MLNVPRCWDVLVTELVLWCCAIFSTAVICIVDDLIVQGGEFFIFTVAFVERVRYVHRPLNTTRPPSVQSGNGAAFAAAPSVGSPLDIARYGRCPLPCVVPMHSIVLRSTKTVCFVCDCIRGL